MKAPHIRNINISRAKHHRVAGKAIVRTKETAKQPKPNAPVEIKRTAQLRENPSAISRTSAPRTARPVNTGGVRPISYEQHQRQAGLVSASRQAVKPVNSARPATASRNIAQPAGAAVVKKKGASPLKIAGIILGALFLLILLLFAGIYLYASFKLNAGNSAVVNDVKHEVPPELTKDKMNILVLGLDYTESDSAVVKRSKENPQADMILYVQYDKKAKTIKMLQIPRDTYVGPNYGTGGTGKINATYSHGENKENRVQNVVQVLNDMYHLTVDHWITIDMESLREMVGIFGGGSGIPVNVPYDMREYDSKTGALNYKLDKGIHNLKGDDLEFFLRARHAEGMHRGDIDRLENQKIFYSALFSYMKTMTWQEMVKLMPFFLNYINTDINPLECAALGVSVLGVPNENILMGTMPSILEPNRAYYNNKYLVVPTAGKEAADFLNENFRPKEAPVPLSDLNIPVLNGLTGPVAHSELKQVSDNGTVADVPEPEPEPQAVSQPVETQQAA